MKSIILGILLFTSVAFADSRNLDPNKDQIGYLTGVINTKSGSVKIPAGAKILTVYVIENVGDITGLVLEIECSPDNTNWFETEDAITARANRNGFAFSFAMNAGDFVRITVATAATDGTSTADLRYAFK